MRTGQRLPTTRTCRWKGTHLPSFGRRRAMNRPTPVNDRDGLGAALRVTVGPPSVESLRNLVDAEHGGIAREADHDGASVNVLGDQLQGSSVGSNGFLRSGLARTRNIERHAGLVALGAGQGVCSRRWPGR